MRWCHTLPRVQPDTKASEKASVPATQARSTSILLYCTGCWKVNGSKQAHSQQGYMIAQRLCAALPSSRGISGGGGGAPASAAAGS